MTESARQLFYKTEDLSKKRSFFESHTFAQTELTYFSQESVLQEIGEKIAILRADEYFNKFLKTFHLSIPPTTSLSPETVLRTMSDWTRSLTKPIAIHIAEQLAKSVGLTIQEVTELRRKALPIPEFIDHTSYQEALNARFALSFFKKDLIKIGRMVSTPSTFVAASSHDLNEQTEEEDLSVEFSILSLAPPATKKSEPLSFLSTTASEERQSSVHQHSLKQSFSTKQPSTSHEINPIFSGEREIFINEAPLPKKIKAY